MLFADVDTHGITVIIAAIFLGAGQVWQIVANRAEARKLRAIAAEEARQLAAVAKKTADAAVKVEEVKKTLSEQDRIKLQKLDEIKDLVNGRLAVALRAIAVLSRQWAIATRDPIDIEAAVRAEALATAEETSRDDIKSAT